MDVPFPKPARLGPATTRWRESDLLAWEGIANIPPEAHRTYLKDADVAARYSVSRATIWRWARDEKAA